MTKKAKKIHRSEPEKLDNWKKVQAVFNKKNISKPLDTRKYVKGKFQDNLEVLQWFKHFFEFYYTEKPYDAYRRRWGLSEPSKYGEIVLSWDEKRRCLINEEASTSTEVKKSSKKKAGVKKKKKGAKKATGGGGELGKENNKLALTVEAVEKERNFYFGKLREIEILCQGDSGVDVKDAADLKAQVLQIMYKTDDDGDMVAPEEGDDNNGDGEENVTF